MTSFDAYTDRTIDAIEDKIFDTLHRIETTSNMRDPWLHLFIEDMTYMDELRQLIDDLELVRYAAPDRFRRFNT